MTEERPIMDRDAMQKLDDTLSTLKFAHKETRSPPGSVFAIAEEIRLDIQQLQAKLQTLDEAMHKAMGSLLDAAHSLNK